MRPPPLALQDIEAVRTIGKSSCVSQLCICSASAGLGGWGSVQVARVKRQSAHPLDRPGATFAVKVVGKFNYRDLERVR